MASREVLLGAEVKRFEEGFLGTEDEGLREAFWAEVGKSTVLKYLSPRLREQRSQLHIPWQRKHTKSFRDSSNSRMSAYLTNAMNRVKKSRKNS